MIGRTWVRTAVGSTPSDQPVLAIKECDDWWAACTRAGSTQAAISSRFSTLRTGLASLFIPREADVLAWCKALQVRRNMAPTCLLPLSVASGGNMVGAGTTATFLIAVLLLLLIPGPAVLLTLARAIMGGRRVGLATASGIAAGDFAHTMLASFGLSAVLLTSTLAFNAIKFAGATYLIVVGVREILTRAEKLRLAATYTVSASQAFRQGLATEFLNPKTALFFLTFLPQFIQPEKGPVFRQFIILGSIIVSMSATYMSLLALTAYKVSRWLLQHQEIGRWQNPVVSMIYITIGIQLAMQEMG